HVTPLFEVSFETVAVKAFVVDTTTVAVVGVTLTEIGGGGGGVPPTACLKAAICMVQTPLAVAVALSGPALTRMRSSVTFESSAERWVNPAPGVADPEFGR